MSQALVIAVGVRETGEREILGFAVGASEEQAFWGELLRSLVARGLAYVEPVTKKMAAKMKDLSDDEKAVFIRAACRRIWLDEKNEVEIELSLPGLEAFALNGPPETPGSTPSPPRGWAP